MAPLQRNASIKSSIVWDIRCLMPSGSNTTRRSAVSQNNVKGVTAATACKATCIIVMATSGRIAITMVIVTTMTSTRRNRRTRLLLIMVTRHSSHALCTDQWASITLRSATRTPRTKTSIKPMTKTLIRGAPQQRALHKWRLWVVC